MTERERNNLIRQCFLPAAFLDDRTLDGRRRLIIKLEGICEAERQRCVEGAWTYDLARHTSLFRALERERAELRALLEQTISGDQQNAQG